jgi:hypothetical protein
MSSLMTVLLPFFRHLTNLFERAWSLAVASMGTTTLAIVVGILVFLLVVVRQLIQKKSAWWEYLKSVAFGVIITLTVWIILFSVCLVETVYRDHLWLVDANQRLQNDLTATRRENDELKNESKATSGTVRENYPTRAGVNTTVQTERRISPAQKITATRHLMAYFANVRRNGAVSIWSLIGDDEALAFSFQLGTLFREAGWTVLGGEVSPHAWKRFSDLPTKGIVVASNRQDHEFLAVEDVILTLQITPRIEIQGANVKPIDGIVVLVGKNQ